MKKKNLVKMLVMFAVIAVILTLDLVTKYVLDATLEYGKQVTVIPFLFNFQLSYNNGAAWGLLAGKQVFLIVLSIVFMAIFIFYYIKEPNKSWLLNITFGFLFAGCLGNLYDRLVFGYVRDFIQFDFWQSFPIFNFADVALCIGVVLFIIYLIIYFVKTRKKEKVKEDKNEKDA